MTGNLRLITIRGIRYAIYAGVPDTYDKISLKITAFNMKNISLSGWYSLGVAALVIGALPSADAQSFTYNNFSDTSGLTINGSAATAVTGDGTVLRLTPNLDSQAGSAFSTTQISLANNASFSTEFTFRITQPGGFGPADGLVFVAQTVANNVGTAGGGIGYAGINHSLGVEFDTWNNGFDNGDQNNGNHVAVNFNGVLNDSYLTSPSTLLSDGDLWYAWIDYNGTTDDLQVRVSDGNPNRPAGAFIDANGINLASILGQPSAYVGFTAATGAGNENHDIVSWAFNDTYQPIQSIPDASATLSLLGLSLSGLGIFARRGKK
jgi:hypothetical protein